MNKAFIFDFDGILVDSEPIWQIENEVTLSQLFGNEIYTKLSPTMVGLSMDAIYQRALELGSTVSKSDFIKLCLERAPEVYRNAPLTPGLQELKNELDKRNFDLGIVSASPIEWIEIVLKRLNWDPSEFKIILSLQTRTDIAHKPSPDGYLHAMQKLGADPKTTIILEDSNPGIQSAKASGATVIGFKANLVKGYNQKGAYFYAENTEEVITLVKKFAV